MDSTALLIGAAVAAAVAVVGCAVARVVPAGHRGVVVRAGRVRRTRATGLAILVPGVERIELVALHPPPIEPLGVTATTRDGVELVDVDLLDAEVRVGPELLRLLA